MNSVNCADDNKILKDNSGILLSVIIPIYNIEEYLSESIESVIHQSYTNLDIILVDDGSLDSSGFIADSFSKKDSRIRVIHKENGGLVSARKAGVAIAKGEYVTFVDGDDWIDENMYRVMLSACKEHLPDVITSGVIREYGENTEIEYDCCEDGYYDEAKLKKDIFPIAMYTGRFYEAGINIHVYNKLFKRELIEEVYSSMLDGINVGEDAAVVYPCIYRAKSIQVVKDAYYHYRIRPGSIMDKRIVDEKEKINLLQTHLTRCFENELFDRKNDIRALVTYLLLLQCPETFIHMEVDGTIYPFSPLKKREKVILYGKGRFGKTLNKLLEEQFLVEIIKWIDVADKESIYKLPEDSYDYIVIAVLKANIRGKIKRELLSQDINKERILSIDEELFQ